MRSWLQLVLFSGAVTCSFVVGICVGPTRVDDYAACAAEARLNAELALHVLALNTKVERLREKAARLESSATTIARECKVPLPTPTASSDL